MAGVPLSMVQADVIGALLVPGFLRYGLPPRDRVELQDLPPANLALFALALVVLFARLLVQPAAAACRSSAWQRREGLLADTDPAATELARYRALKMPFYRTLISLGYWSVGSVVFIAASWPVAKQAAPVVAVATAWVRQRPRSSAICRPSGFCARSPSPPCGPGCPKTSAPPGSSGASC